MICAAHLALVAFVIGGVKFAVGGHDCGIGESHCARGHGCASEVEFLFNSQIQDTWKVVEKDMDNHAVKFYETMLEMSPEIRQLFVNRSEYNKNRHTHPPLLIVDWQQPPPLASLRPEA